MCHAVNVHQSAHKWCEVANCLLYACVKIRNIWEILPGQYRNNAGDEFVNGVKGMKLNGQLFWAKLSAQFSTIRCHRDWLSVSDSESA